MNDFDNNFRGILRDEAVIGLSWVHKYSHNNHHLLNCPRSDHIVSPILTEMHPSRAEHVVCKDKVFWGKFLRRLDFSPYLVPQHLTKILASIGGMRQFIVQIPKTDMILVGYLMKGQVSNISRIVKCRIRSGKGVMALSRIRMVHSKILLMILLESIRNISLHGKFRDIIGGLGGAIL